MGYEKRRVVEGRQQRQQVVAKLDLQPMAGLAEPALLEQDCKPG